MIQLHYSVASIASTPLQEKEEELRKMLNPKRKRRSIGRIAGDGGPASVPPGCSFGKLQCPVMRQGIQVG